MNVYQLKACARATRKAGIDDASLSDAIKRAVRGEIDADLGGDLIKQRIARPGAGRSGGHRYLIAFRREHRAVFLFGFAKSAKDNIADDETKAAKRLGSAWLDLTGAGIDRAIKDKQLIRVNHHHEEDVRYVSPQPLDAGDGTKR